MSPQIILLNGVSSAGKSSIARALQGSLDAPYLHVCIDTFEEMMPNRHEFVGEFGKERVFQKMLSGFHHSLGAIARCGNNMIVDHVLVEGEEPQNWVSECLSQLELFDVFFVGVRCGLPELERRERERGDRPAGLAKWQHTRMHRTVVYDFEVDTSAATPHACAEAIIAAMERVK